MRNLIARAGRATAEQTIIEVKRVSSIWAHRGARNGAPENSMRAFRLARDLGADGIEFDVRFSDDLVPFVLHDKKLDRTTNEAGPISEVSAAKLAEFGVPTLAEVLAEFSGEGLTFNIEIKSSRRGAGVVRPLLDVVGDFDIADRCWLSSFDASVLREVGARFPTGLLVHRAARRPLRTTAELGCPAIHPHRHLVSPAFMAKARSRGLRVHPWTVNKVSDIARMVELGADAIITDLPDLALQVRGLAQATEPGRAR